MATHTTTTAIHTTTTAIHTTTRIHTMSACHSGLALHQNVSRISKYYYQAPSSGPSQYQHINRFSGTEPQNSSHNIHESNGTIGEDSSTGIHPGHAQIGANFGTGVGEVWRTPSKNPLMVDRNLT